MMNVYTGKFDGKTVIVNLNEIVKVFGIDDNDYLNLYYLLQTNTDKILYHEKGKLSEEFSRADAEYIFNCITTERSRLEML
jgi:hypothetical protein